MANPQPEPSMEEILASIRRIISEDEEEGVTADLPVDIVEEPAPPQKAEEPVAEEAPSAPATPQPVAEEVKDDDAAETHLVTEDVEMIKKNVAAAIQEEDVTDFVDETAASAASQAFHSLSQSVRVSDAEGPGKTLENIVTEMLRPMLKEWLDANLPAIVEEKVEEEVQRIARRRR